jgi:hypothetical protein
MRYATGFFIIDFMSILPFYATSFVLAEGPVICNPITGRIVNASAPVSESLAGKASSTVKIIKLLRMLKLARVLKASGVLKRIVEDVLMSKFELTYAMLTVLKMICGVILLAHLQACLWALVPYFMSDELIPADGRPQTWVHRFRMDQEERGGTSTGVDVYVASLYWSIMTLTSIGCAERATAALHAFCLPRCPHPSFSRDIGALSSPSPSPSRSLFPRAGMEILCLSRRRSAFSAVHI